MRNEHDGKEHTAPMVNERMDPSLEAEFDRAYRKSKSARSASTSFRRAAYTLIVASLIEILWLIMYQSRDTLPSSLIPAMLLLTLVGAKVLFAVSLGLKRDRSAPTSLYEQIAATTGGSEKILQDLDSPAGWTGVIPDSALEAALRFDMQQVDTRLNQPRRASLARILAQNAGNADLQLAIIEVLERTGGSEAYGALWTAGNGASAELRSGLVVKAARRAFPVVEARAAQEAEPASLLRASDDTTEEGQRLLRASSSTGGQRHDRTELARPGPNEKAIATELHDD